MIATEVIFLQVCEANDLSDAVGDLSAAELVELIEWLEQRGAPAEVADQVWAACAEEAKRRWIKIMKGDREG